MKENEFGKSDDRLEAFLDELLDEQEKAEFLSETEDHQMLDRIQQFQREIDQSLQRSFDSQPLSDDRINALANRRETALTTPRLFQKTNWMQVAAAAVILICSALVIWYYSQTGTTEPHFQTRSLTAIYQETRERGFQPYYECEDLDRFAAVFDQRQQQPLSLTDPMPDGREMLGLSYLGGLSRATTAMLGRVDETPVMVFVDRIENDDPFFAESTDTNLNIFRRSERGLVFYEVTPLPESSMNELFEFLKKSD